MFYQQKKLELDRWEQQLKKLERALVKKEKQLAKRELEIQQQEKHWIREWRYTGKTNHWQIGGEIYAWNDDKTKLIKTVLEKIDGEKRLFITKDGKFKNAEII